MFEISLFDILTFGAATTAALMAWRASQAYEDTTRRMERAIERAARPREGDNGDQAAMRGGIKALQQQAGEIARDVKGLVDANANAQVETASLSQNITALLRETGGAGGSRHEETLARIDAAAETIGRQLAEMIGPDAAGVLGERLAERIAAAFAGETGERIARAVAAAAKNEIRKGDKPAAARKTTKKAAGRRGAAKKSETPTGTAADAAAGSEAEPGASDAGATGDAKPASEASSPGIDGDGAGDESTQAVEAGAPAPPEGGNAAEGTPAPGEGNGTTAAG